MYSASTIAALSTPHGAAALAVLRMCGPQTFCIIEQCLSPANRFATLPAFSIGLFQFVDKNTNEIIDQVSVIKYVSPKSFTGEDMVEIICHGSMTIVERILEQLINFGASYAEKGEFTRRAFLSGKIDLAKAEAIGQLVSSRSIDMQRLAAHVYMGGHNSILATWRSKIETILRDIESHIEFNEEEDVNRSTNSYNLEENISELISETKEQLERRGKIQEREQGISIVFVGSPNVGKSTLLNLLLGYERSIVFSEAGTTRDAVSEWVSWQGLNIKFIDCAGIHDTKNQIEQLGVERSWSFVRSSDVVVLVTAAGEPITTHEQEIITQREKGGTLLGVINKCDSGSCEEKAQHFETRKIPYLCTSAINVSNRSVVIDFILNSIKEKRPSLEQQSFICTKRQEEILKKTIEELENMKMAGVAAEEIAAFHGRKILALYDDYVGKTVTDDILNAIFNEFCIGK